MQATRILPDLQCSLLCEEIRQEVTGNFFLIGVINFIRVPQVPVVAFKLSLFDRWTAGIGQFTESVRLIAPDQTTVLRKGEVKFVLQDTAMQATNVTVFGQVEFKTAGTYFVEVLVDDVMKLRYPVPVILAPPQNQPPAGPPPETPASLGQNSPLPKRSRSQEAANPRQFSVAVVVCCYANNFRMSKKSDIPGNIWRLGAKAVNDDMFSKAAVGRIGLNKMPSYTECNRNRQSILRSPILSVLAVSSCSNSAYISVA